MKDSCRSHGKNIKNSHCIRSDDINAKHKTVESSCIHADCRHGLLRKRFTRNRHSLEHERCAICDRTDAK